MTRGIPGSPAAPPHHPTPAGSAVATTSPLSMETADPMEGTSGIGQSTGPLRRSQRETAGKHTNLHHLPVKVGRKGTGAVTSRVPGSGNMISGIYRPWY